MIADEPAAGIAWWPLDQVDSAFMTTVDNDAKFLTTRDVDNAVPTDQELKDKIKGYKDEHKTTKLKRIAGMGYTAKVKITDGSWSDEYYREFGPDIWLGIGTGSSLATPCTRDGPLDYRLRPFR